MTRIQRTIFLLKAKIFLKLRDSGKIYPRYLRSLNALLELHNLIDECVVDLVLVRCIKLVSKKVFVNRY